MTTIARSKNRCAICGAVEEYSEIASTNAFGSTDLDTRPPEMKRSTMYLWVQECPRCGYVSEDVSDPTSVTREWLRTEKYLKCDGISFASDLAKRFYKHYLIKVEDKETWDAFFAILYAAWACDDAGDIENAKHCRKLAVSLAAELINDNCENKDNIITMKADLMRRAGMFDEMLNEYASIALEEELLNQILAFELKLAKEKDDACYKVTDALED